MPERKIGREYCRILILIALALGAVCGVVMASRLGIFAMESVKINLDGYMYTVSGDGQTETTYIFLHSLVQNTLTMLMLFLSGLSVFFVPLAPALVCLRMLGVAFTCSCIARCYGWIGGIGAFVSVGIPSFFALLFLSYASVLAMENVGKRLGRMHVGDSLSMRIGVDYVNGYVILGGAMVCASLLDGFFTPGVMGFFARLIG